ncbi:MAG: MFS transporter, partial [Alistipes sp.]|nr:MFS transporter [Alistipes sp.]
TAKAQATTATAEPELSKEETKQRIVALGLVFAVVIFFWMAFHQNGLTLTFFARDYTATSSTGIESMLFDVRNLLACIFIVYGIFGIFQTKGICRIVAGVLIVAGIAFLIGMLPEEGTSVGVSAPIFQQFNAFYVVALTPVSMAIFGALASKGKEPKAPRKIAYGMLVAALGFAVMLFASMGLPTPDEQAEMGDAAMLVSPSWLIYTYLVLTFAE